jgi:hypothetical protein
MPRGYPNVNIDDPDLRWSAIFNVTRDKAEKVIDLLGGPQLAEEDSKKLLKRLYRTLSSIELEAIDTAKSSEMCRRVY